MRQTRRVRNLLGGGVCLLLVLSASAGQAQTLDALAKLAGLLEKAGDIIANLANGIEEANAAGLRIYDTHEARAAYDRLLDLRTDILVLPMVQRALVLDPIDAYLEAPSTEAWAEVQANLEQVLAKVVDIEGRLIEERSDFVLHPDFPELLNVVTARRGLLVKLMALEPPETEPELEALRQVRERYARLVEALDRLRQRLDDYLRRTED